MSCSECSSGTINSVSDLLLIIAEIEQKFFDPGMSESLVWYRGHGNQEWKLQPQVLRETFLDSANNREFQKFNDRYYQGLAVERTINQIFRGE